MSLKTVSHIELGLLDMDNVSKLYEISVRGNFEAYLQYMNYDMFVLVYYYYMNGYCKRD